MSRMKTDSTGTLLNPNGVLGDNNVCNTMFNNGDKPREFDLAKQALANAMAKLKQEKNSPNPRPGVIANCERIIAEKQAFLESQGR